MTPSPTPNAELPGLTIENGGLYKTRNGSVIEASECIYMPNYKGPIRLEFSMAYESPDNAEKDLLGYVILYDENLCHKQGNHVDRDEGLDIIERFEGVLPERCPNCRHCLGKISYTRAPAEKGDMLDIPAMQQHIARMMTEVAMPHIPPERKAEWDAKQKRHQEIADFIKSRIFADLLEDALRSTGLINGGVDTPSLAKSISDQCMPIPQSWKEEQSCLDEAAKKLSRKPVDVEGLKIELHAAVERDHAVEACPLTIDAVIDHLASRGLINTKPEAEPKDVDALHLITCAISNAKAGNRDVVFDIEEALFLQEALTRPKEPPIPGLKEAVDWFDIDEWIMHLDIKSDRTEKRHKEYAAKVLEAAKRELARGE
jgi:hypothetical protein